MNLSNLRALKSEISAEVVAAAPTSEIATLFASSAPPMPEGVALGVAPGDGFGDYKLAIRTEDPALAAEYVARANGEAEVKIVRVEMRATPHSSAWLQERHRPGEGGMQVNIRGANFVGTLGAFVKDKDGILYALSNSHVFADMGRTPIGTLIGAPFGRDGDYIGSLTRFVPFSTTTPNKVDCAIVRLVNTGGVAGTFNGALQGNIRGARHTSSEDLHIDVLKIGRTTGVRGGKIVATEIDGLSVNMGDLGVLRFDEQLEISGGTATDFSAAGDSGSLIVDRNGFGIGLLFAGGTSDGIDLTFANRIDLVLESLGVELLVAA